MPFWDVLKPISAELGEQSRETSWFQRSLSNHFLHDPRDHRQHLETIILSRPRYIADHSAIRSRLHRPCIFQAPDTNGDCCVLGDTTGADSHCVQRPRSVESVGRTLLASIDEDLDD